MKRASLTPSLALAAGVTRPTAAPVVGAATAGVASASVAFTQIAGGSNGGSAVTAYLAVGSDGSSGSAATSPITVNGVTPGMDVTFTVYATNIAGMSDGSAASNSIVATAPATIPSPPLSLALSALASSISVAYAAPTSNGGSAILDYLFTDINGVKTVITTNPQTIPANPNQLTSGYLQARNLQGLSLPSPQALPVMPTGAAAGPVVATGLTQSLSSATGNVGDTRVLTVKATPTGGTITGTLTITPTPVAGLTISPASQTMTTGVDVQFNVTATVAGTYAINIANNGGLANPSAVSYVASAAAASRLLWATVENRPNNGLDNRGVGSTINWFARFMNITGSGPQKSLVGLFHGRVKYNNQQNVNIPNNVNITKMTVEIVGITPSPVPVTVAGSRAFSVAPGPTLVATDAVMAAQLDASLTALPIGTKFWVKIEGTLPSNSTTGQSLPISQRTVDDNAGSLAGWYDPAATQIVNGADVSGPFTFTGTYPSTRTNSFLPAWVANYVSDNVVVTAVAGDSETQGLFDNNSATQGRGWFQYMLAGDKSASPSTGWRSGYNGGVSGDTASSQNSDSFFLQSIGQFSTDDMCTTGVNDMGGTASGSPSAIHALKLACLAKMAAAKPTGYRAPRKVMMQMPPQSLTSNPTKTINSAPNTGWGVGENAAQLDALAAAAVGTGDIFAYMPTPSIRQTSDLSLTTSFLWKYKTGGTNVYDTDLTSDGQHYLTAGVILAAADVNPVYRTIPTT